MNQDNADSRNPKHALIIKFGQIGDAIMAVPAAYALYQQGYVIHWVCGHAVYPLLACYTWIHPIAVDDKAIFYGNFRQKAQEIIRILFSVSRRRYDFAAILYYDYRYRLLFMPVRSRRKVGFSYLSRATTLLPGRHHTDEYRRIILGDVDSCRDTSTCPVLPDQLPASPLPKRKTPFRILIIPGGVRHLIREQTKKDIPDQLLRCWPIERYVELASVFHARGWEIVLLGSAEDTWIMPYFAHLKVTSCLGTLTLPEVVSVCNESSAIVTHDTGPLHLAGLSDICIVGVFGPTDPATRVPRRPYATGIWGGRGFACRPCYNGRDFAPCEYNGCMYQVTVDDVLSELDRLLDARDRGVELPWRVIEPALRDSLVTIRPSTDGTEGLR